LGFIRHVCNSDPNYFDPSRLKKSIFSLIPFALPIAPVRAVVEFDHGESREIGSAYYEIRNELAKAIEGGLPAACGIAASDYQQLR